MEIVKILQNGIELDVNDTQYSTATTTTNGLMSSADKTKLNGVEAWAEKNNVTSADITNWNNKVDKVSGKQLSTNDYTTTEKNKLEGIETAAEKNTITSVQGRTGAVTISKSDVGLSNVDNVKQATKVEHEELDTKITSHLEDEVPHVKMLGDLILNTDSGNDYPLGVSIHEVGSKNWGNGYPLDYGIVLSYKQRSLRFVQFMYGHIEPVTYTRVWYNGNWSEWESVATLNDIPMTKINELNYTKAMTQEQYDALSQAEKDRTDVWYGIYEG